MRKLFFIAAMIILNFAQAQKISLLPTATGTGKGGFVAIVQNGVTKKLLIDSLVNAGLKPLYRDLTVTPNTTTVFNFDSSTTAKLTTNGTVNIDIQGALPLGSSGVLAVTQSATGGDLLKYNNVNINIAKIANKTSLVGFVKFLNNFIFSVDTSSNIISQTGFVAAVTFDSSAQALFTAAATNFTYQTAVNNAIVALKGITLAAGGTAWSKSVLVNGRAGTNLTQQSFNWRNPAQYNYVYYGTTVYNPKGSDFTGGNYLSTGITPSTAFTGTTTDITLVSVIGRVSGYGIYFGAIDGANGIPFYVETDTNYIHPSFYVNPVTLSTSPVGRFIFSYQNATTFNSYKNGNLLDTRAATPTGTFINLLLLEGAAGSGGAYTANARIDVTQIINSKLTASEAQQIDAVWANYQTALNR